MLDEELMNINVAKNEEVIFIKNKVLKINKYSIFKHWKENPGFFLCCFMCIVLLTTILVLLILNYEEFST